MKAAIRVRGANELMAQLRYTGERVLDKARKTMHRQADKIVEEARLNAPVDKHNLEQSIRKEVSYGVRGRLQIDIVAGGFINGVNVDLYVMEVHENYASMGVGPGTAAKRAANPGRYIGEKFLDRAVKARRDKLNAAMIDAVNKEWHL